ncbi:hypothetical protein N0V82_008602 [Gnomoniopsis sp. IMI 355080]|nr:hypothetical protein N0V82_008602 [Gnomoniopsis sp. IMI 355080]
MSSNPSSDSNSSSKSDYVEPHNYEPSPIDVVVTKMMLQQGLKLPAEVVLSILDFAEYWPHTSATLDSSFITMSGGDRENRFVLRTKPLGLIKTPKDEHGYTFTRVEPKPLPDGAEYPVSQFQTWIGGPTDTIQYPCRKIVFTITSHDQGWSNTARQDRGSYRGSYTWCEAGLERFGRSADPESTSDEKAAAGVSVERRVSTEEAPAEATEGESSKLAALSEKPSDHQGDPSPEFNDDSSDPYPPVHDLRPIYPTLEPNADPPALHFDLLASPRYTIQHNKTATRNPTTHTVVWSWNDNIDPPTAQQLKDNGRGEETGTGDFVRNLKLGDVVTVWAKSRFGGWANHVDAVKVDIYWAL